LSLFGGKREDRDGTGSATRASAPAPTPNPIGTRRQQPNEEGSEVANIGKSISIRGDLTGNEDMVIEGQVEGKVDLPNNQLTVGANGNVKAEIHAKGVVIVGHVAGNVFGLERVEIQATGRVEGDVTAPKLVVAEGAQLNGVIQMTQKGNRPAAAGAEAAASSEAAAAPTAAGVRKIG
jgi:cytoskeletal protein CcmA (bactofilin family)